MFEKLLIGSDPEMFMETPHGQFLNAFDGLAKGYLKGTKYSPEITDYGAIQVDGMALEINTIPTTDPDDFNKLIEAGISDALHRFPNSCLDRNSVRHFSAVYLEKQPSLAIELGCDPDFDAWGEIGDSKQPPSMYVPFRTAGGHLHFGWTESANIFDHDHMTSCCNVIKQLDYALGMWSIKVDKLGAERRKLYGMAGSYRPKTYGVEYRVLSNFWIMFRDTRRDVFNRSVAALKALDDGVAFYEDYGDFAKKVIELGSIDKSGESILTEVDNTLKHYGV